MVFEKRSREYTDEVKNKYFDSDGMTSQHWCFHETWDGGGDC